MANNNVDITLIISALFDQIIYIMEQTARNPLALVAAGCAVCSASMYLFKFLVSRREVF